HGTVEQVVGRLAMIESDIHGVALGAPRSQGSISAADKSARSASSDGSSLSPADGELADRQDFIAAARRATQAAAILPHDDAIRSGWRRRRRVRRSDRAATDGNGLWRLRKVLFAAGIVVVTVGCLQIALHIYQDGTLHDTRLLDTRLQDPRLQDARPQLA